ncbi:guanitoxin biosynthesis L-arginine gamma (S) hydroxylase [Alcaligenes phenolicus]
MSVDLNFRLQKHRFSPDILLDIKKLYKLDNYHSIFALFSNYFFVVLSVFLAEKWFFLAPLSILVIGSRQRALATLLHESSHLVLAKNRILNRAIGTFFSGCLVFQTWDSYKKSHVLDHHIFLGNKHRDPDYSYYISSGVYNKHTRLGFYLNFFIKPIFQINFFENLRYLIGHRLLKNLSGFDLFSMLLSLFVFGAIGTYFVGWYFFLLYWLLPYLTVFQTISWFIETAEHYPLVGKAEVDLYASRNRFGNVVENFFTGIHNERFHLVHHLFPAIPFWNMRKAHSILLRDGSYFSVNSRFGGIFSSTTHSPPLWLSNSFQANKKD